MIRYLTREEVLELHRLSLERFGGMDGIRDDGMLDSAVAQPQAAFGGHELYPSLAEKAASLGFSLIRNHPFIDGNKWTGFAALAVFLDLNSTPFVCTTDEGESVVLAVAAGTMNREQPAKWVQSRLQD